MTRSNGLGANVSYAGILELVYYEAKSGKVYALDAGWNSWHQEHGPGSLPSDRCTIERAGRAARPRE
jgi:hypothetical protein